MMKGWGFTMRNDLPQWQWDLINLGAFIMLVLALFALWVSIEGAWQ